MMIGLVGAPNKGKTKFFKALTLMDAESANYPFTTIDPNKGIGFVRNNCVDSFFNTQCNPRHGFCKEHIRFIPVDIIDVAGLVPGASEGRGLGNKFLTDLYQAQALIQVIDISGSTDEEGRPVPLGSYDPANEIDFLLTEIETWLLGIFKKNFEKLGREQQVRKIKTLNTLLSFMSGMGVNEEILDQSLKSLNLQDKDVLSWSETELLNFTKKIREKTKPIVIAANKIDLLTNNKKLDEIKEKFPNIKIIGCCAEAELALKSADKNKIVEYLPGSNSFKILKEDIPEKQLEALKFIQKNILDKHKSTGVQEIVDFVAFEVLKYMAIYPGGTKSLKDKNGNVLPDCFLMPPKSTTLDFAYKLHTDFGNNFIKAVDVKTKMLLGKEHLLKNNDVIEIISGK
ncbi:MAG: YchF-related putative GTPase [Candidatus ainarchaeum sp.]|nr:YchF-related putative GTPase [Candidatus ainarchaeum sp.]